MTTEMVPARSPRGIEMRSLDDAERLARVAVASGLLAVRRPEEAVVLLLTGRELGLSPMQSLRGIYVVSGRPVLSADLLLAVVRRSGLCQSWRTVESTPERCTLETLRVGESQPARRTWTLEDARRAGLGGKGPWTQYPAQMLRHRCTADLAREVYPDVVLGVYAEGELPEDSGSRESEASTPPHDCTAWRAEALELAALAGSVEELRSLYRGYVAARAADPSGDRDLVAACARRRDELRDAAEREAIASEPAAPEPPEEPPPPIPPRGRRRPVSAPGSEGATSATTRGEPLETPAQREAHVSSLGHVLAVRASWLRHRGLEGYEALCVARVQALTGCVDPEVARRYLRGQSEVAA